MDAIATHYEGYVLVRQVSGADPYFGHYRFAAKSSDIDAAMTWVDLGKSWPTEQLACEDAWLAGRFAIDGENYSAAVAHATEAAAAVMMLACDDASWPAAVRAQRTAAARRDLLESRLLGARERHWPELLTRRTLPMPSRCR